jgi:hypothetical protein
VSQFTRTPLQSRSGADSGAQKSTEAYPRRLFPNGGVAAKEIAGPWLWIRLNECLANEKSFPMQDLLRLHTSVPQPLNGIGPRRSLVAVGAQTLNPQVSNVCKSRQPTPFRLHPRVSHSSKHAHIIDIEAP